MVAIFLSRFTWRNIMVDASGVTESAERELDDRSNRFLPHCSDECGSLDDRIIGDQGQGKGACGACNQAVVEFGNVSNLSR